MIRNRFTQPLLGYIPVGQIATNDATHWVGASVRAEAGAMTVVAVGILVMLRPTSSGWCVAPTGAA
jgi:hypothetical protein